MNYLLDKKTKRNRILKPIIAVVVIIILFFFRASIFSGLSYVTGGVFRPAFSSGNIVSRKLGSIGSYFSRNSTLARENQNLKSQIDQSAADRANYDSVVAENASLKETLSRKPEGANMTLATILAKPNQSPYDTLVIDIGKDKGVKVDSKVFASGNIPIGHVAEVDSNTSKVILFSNSGEVTQVMIKPARTAEGVQSGGDTSMELVGRGGGNFEMKTPKDFTLLKGDQAILPSINNYVIGTVETIISDAHDSFQKALLTTPVNIQQLKFVQVEQ